MLTTKINKKALEQLTKFFDNYCKLIYGRTYPLTDNNLINYFKDVISYHLNKTGGALVETERVGYNVINENEFTKWGWYVIRNNKIHDIDYFIDFDNCLKELNYVNNKDK